MAKHSAEKDAPSAGRDAPCANCGHRYGRHTLADCREMIQIHGGEKSCTCPGWASVIPPAKTSLKDAR